MKISTNPLTPTLKTPNSRQILMTQSYRAYPILKQLIVKANIETVDCVVRKPKGNQQSL